MFKKLKYATFWTCISNLVENDNTNLITAREWGQKPVLKGMLRLNVKGYVITVITWPKIISILWIVYGANWSVERRVMLQAKSWFYDIYSYIKLLTTHWCNDTTGVGLQVNTLPNHVGNYNKKQPILNINHYRHALFCGNDFIVNYVTRELSYFLSLREGRGLIVINNLWLYHTSISNSKDISKKNKW